MSPNGMPGQYPITPFNDNQNFSISPLPATSGTSNPITLAPGQPVPHPSTFTDSTIHSNVKLDKESYERSGSGAPQLPPLFSQGHASDPLLPSTSANLIPESSLPMNDIGRSVTVYTTSSIAPNSTTARLAGQQPIEPRGVPSIVSESQRIAHVDPEASAAREAVKEKRLVEDELKQKVTKVSAIPDSGLADVNPSGSIPSIVSESQKLAHSQLDASQNPEAVREKTLLEDELRSKIPQAGATSESGMFGKSEKGYVATAAGSVVAAAAAVTGAAYAAKDRVSDAATNAINGFRPEEPLLPQSKPDEERLPTSNTTDVPKIVRESQQKANVSPEASASAAAVKEKHAVEQELASKVKTSHETGRPAPSTTTADVPEVVRESQQKANVSPEASASAEAVQEKHAVEQELANKVKTSHATGRSAPSTTTADVPAVVRESQQKANVSPEASASATIVQEKHVMEQELASRVKTSHSTGISAPSATIADVPAVVRDSQTKANVPPEASSSPDMVREKQAMEAELASKARSSGGVTGALTSSAPSHVGYDSSANHTSSAPSHVSHGTSAESELTSSTSTTTAQKGHLWNSNIAIVPAVNPLIGLTTTQPVTSSTISSDVLPSKSTTRSEPVITSSNNITQGTTSVSQGLNTENHSTDKSAIIPPVTKERFPSPPPALEDKSSTPQKRRPLSLFGKTTPDNKKNKESPSANSTDAGSIGSAEKVVGKKRSFLDKIKDKLRHSDKDRTPTP